MTRDDASKALTLYDKLDGLKKFRDVAESYYASAQVSVDNTAGRVCTLKITASKALALVNEQIAEQEAELTSLGFNAG